MKYAYIWSLGMLWISLNQLVSKEAELLELITGESTQPATDSKALDVRAIWLAVTSI